LPFLLDTNVVIHARDGNHAVLAKFAEHEPTLLISAISLVELQRCVFKDPANTAIRQERLAVVLETVPVVPFDAAAARAYGRIIALRGWVKGCDFDRMIAAHAISLRAVLVTNNSADFLDIPGLTLEDWSSDH
jgi:predicted nucleic acid-binding protein